MKLMRVKSTEQLQAAGIRVESDLRNEKLGYKIREAQLEKAPYMLVVGENEANSEPYPCGNAAKAISAPSRWRN